jgi:DNA polymerase (family 10)
MSPARPSASQLADSATRCKQERGWCGHESNANPIRLDLSAELARRAILASQGLAAGCRLAIGSDAHAPEHFDFLRLGVLTARRGWATAKDVVNTLLAWTG